MAKIDKGLCPSCFKERELALFKFGVINTTMCPYCISRYLLGVVIPILDKNNNTRDDNLISEVFSNDTTK